MFFVENKKGFALVELTVAIMILTVFLLTFAGFFYTMRVNLKLFEANTEAMEFMIDELEIISMLDYDYVNSNNQGVSLTPDGTFKSTWTVNEELFDEINGEDPMKVVDVRIDYTVGKANKYIQTSIVKVNEVLLDND